MGNVAATPAAWIPRLDSATALLAAAGTVIAFAQPPEEAVEFERLSLFWGNLWIVAAMLRDRRRTCREGATRVFAPTSRQLAFSALIIAGAAVVCSWQAGSTGYGWIYLGFFMSCTAVAAQRLVLFRPS